MYFAIHTIKKNVALSAGLLAAMLAPATRATEVTLDNGVVGDGHFSVTVDDFGSFADAFQGGPQWVDFFDPSAPPGAPALPENFATFSTNLFFFIDPSNDGNGSHQGVATGHSGIAATYDDGNVTCVVDQDNSVTNLPLATDSVFSCTGPANFSIEVTLNQNIQVLSPGPANEARALLEQIYTIRNTGSAGMELIIVKHIDEDMLWGGDATNDLVGADFAELGRPQVYAQDNDLTTAALVLRTRDNHDPDLPNAVPNSVDFIYYCGKQSLTPNPNPEYPGGDCPPYDYGTDDEIWLNYGAPNCWKNNVPGVGHDIPGISPQLNGDSHMGLQVEAAIAPNATYEIAYHTIYGFRPEPTLQTPPPLIVDTIALDSATGCGEFFWSITNNNPIVVGEDFVNIATFYLDIEAGDGGDSPCVLMTPPAGWTVELCSSDANGHSLYKFTGGTPLAQGDTAHGRMTLNTNGLNTVINPLTQAEVPPLSIVVHAAQEQESTTCDFNFGPERDGDWSAGQVGTAFLPVPSLTAWSKPLLAGLILFGGALLVMRSRRPLGVS